MTTQQPTADQIAAFCDDLKASLLSARERGENVEMNEDLGYRRVQYLSPCGHAGDGWCLGCVGNLRDTLMSAGSLADIADQRADAVKNERARCARVLRTRLASCHYGIAQGVLQEALTDIEGKPVVSKPVCSKHKLAGCPACKGEW